MSLPQTFPASSKAMGVPHLSQLLLPYVKPLQSLTYNQSRIFIGFDIASPIIALWEKYFDRCSAGYEKRIASLITRQVLDTVGLICQISKPQCIYVYMALEAPSGKSVAMKEATREKRVMKERPNYGAIGTECRILLKEKKFVQNFCSQSYLGELYNLKRIIWEIDDMELPCEGEHKIFARAAEIKCKHPFVVSIDGDCIHIGLVRLQANHFDDITVINTKSQSFVNISSLPRNWCEILFALGNDFLLPILSGTQKQLDIISESITLEETIQKCISMKVLKSSRKKLETSYNASISEFAEHINEIIKYYCTAHSDAACKVFDRNELLQHWSKQKFNFIYPTSVAQLSTCKRLLYKFKI